VSTESTPSRPARNGNGRLRVRKRFMLALLFLVAALA
jgi:hypothetical protein